MEYRIETWSLTLAGRGALLPWLGPALRGLTALRFKERVCKFPPAEREQRWQRCTGCPHMAGCAYGQTLEPDPPPGRLVLRGRESPAPPVMLAPGYPLPAEARPGMQIPLRVLAVGEAVRHLPALLDIVGEAGRRGGLGEGGVPFDLLGPDRVEAGQLSPAELPRAPAALSGWIPRLEVGLTSPLFLTRRDGERRLPVRVPALADLVRAALRTVSDLFRLYGEPLEADFKGLAEAAQGVVLAEHGYEPFEQERRSSRSGAYTAYGVVGGGVYDNVPLGLLPWLLWGGRLHVGTHRVAGAGGWRLVLD